MSTSSLQLDVDAMKNASRAAAQAALDEHKKAQRAPIRLALNFLSQHKSKITILGLASFAIFLATPYASDFRESLTKLVCDHLGYLCPPPPPPPVENNWFW